VRYIYISSIAFCAAISFIFSGCSSVFLGNSSQIPKHSAAVPSAKQDIPYAKVRPYAYSGILKRCHSSFWHLPLFRSNYDYCIVDTRGNTIAFLDISDLATRAPLANLIDKTITVNGPSFSHKFRGVVVIKAKYIAIPETL
jgi:hypothetical protein